MKKIMILSLTFSAMFLITAFSCGSDSNYIEPNAEPEFTEEADPGKKDENNQQAKTGIEGTVLMGPMCPVVTYPSSCPDQPFSALFHVFDQAGTEVTTFQSDEQGHFRVEVSSGEYNIIVDESVAFLQRRQSKKVIVNENEFTPVTLLFDTGIR